MKKLILAVLLVIALAQPAFGDYLYQVVSEDTPTAATNYELVDGTAATAGIFNNINYSIDRRIDIFEDAFGTSVIAVTSPYILIANNSQFNAVAMSGDATISNTGVLTLSNTEKLTVALNTFAELNTLVANKTLVNEEDAATWDALQTFSAGATIATGQAFTVGSTRWDNGSDAIDGDKIADDTIDDDALDFTDITGADLTLTDCGTITASALITANLGLTISTGDPFTLGANRIDNGSDLLDGDKIADDTIDDDSIDWSDVTGADLTLTDCGAITSSDVVAAQKGILAAVTAFPAAPTAGQHIYHSTYAIDAQWNGTGWVTWDSLAALDLYVDGGSGTDGAGYGYGSGADATATIQYCIDYCVPKSYFGNVTVHIAAGTYNEDVFIKDITPKGNYTLTLEGAWSESLAEATVDAGSVQGTGATQGTLVDAAPAWTDDLYNNKWVKFEDDTTTAALQGDIRLIDDTVDAGDYLTIVGCWDAAPVAGDTYTIQDLGTIIDTLSVGAGQKSIAFSKIHVLMDITSMYLGVANSGGTLTNCKISHASGSVVYIDGGSTSTLYSCFFSKARVFITNGSLVYDYRDKFLDGSSANIIQVLNGGILRSSFGSVIDANSTDRNGVTLTSNGNANFLSTAAFGYVRIRNASQAGDIGIEATTGAQVINTSNNVYTNNTANETADAASFAYID